jgi:hypothetical protein
LQRFFGVEIIAMAVVTPMVMELLAADDSCRLQISTSLDDWSQKLVRRIVLWQQTIVVRLDPIIIIESS